MMVICLAWYDSGTGFPSNEDTTVCVNPYRTNAMAKPVIPPVSACIGVSFFVLASCSASRASRSSFCAF